MIAIPKVNKVKVIEIEGDLNSYDTVFKLNVRGTIISIDAKIIENHSDSALEVICSGRHGMKLVDGLPFLDKDPVSF